MVFYFKNAKKDIIMTPEDKEGFDNKNKCRLCEKEKVSDKVEDHCHWTGKNRGPAHIKCNNIVTQDQSNFIPNLFHYFGTYGCHLFFKKLVDYKKNEVKFKILTKKKGSIYFS